jgi:stage V sporulation protein SpoVS
MTEEILLKVAANTPTPKLAGAIVKNMQEGKRVLARAYGTQALYALCKGAAMANAYMDGLDQVWLLPDTTMIEAPNHDSIREFTFQFRFMSEITAPQESS